ncbi:MAG: peptidylprolyl isomerase [Planctomycetes bacterium]|nr:peptidylprolyl isomerase [Planctomycetota bacterium]
MIAPFVTVLLIATSATAQTPPPAVPPGAPLRAGIGDQVARFRLEGAPATVDRAELAAEVALRFRRSESGEEALELLIGRELVAVEARAQGVAPTPTEIDARADEIRAELARNGYTLDAWLTSKRMTPRAFRDEHVAPSIAHEKLVMRAMELDSRREVTPELLKLWLGEARLRHRVETDPGALPAGVVARVDEREFGLVDLGLALLPNVADDERERLIRRIVIRRLLAAEARRAGIEVTEADTRAELERRRDRVEGDPRYQGVGFDEWLRATQGLTPAELARSPSLVATVLHERLIERRFPPDELRRRFAEDRAGVLARHGEKRRIAIVLIRALEEPNRLVTRDFASAEREADDLLQQLRDGTPFDKLARIHSEDPYSKVRGGELGAIARGDDAYPEELRAAAFAIGEPLTVTGPIRVPQGVALVKLLGVEPAPPEPELLAALRDELGQQYLRDLLDAAELQIL